jgi:hypothetical protein
MTSSGAKKNICELMINPRNSACAEEIGGGAGQKKHVDLNFGEKNRANLSNCLIGRAMKDKNSLTN